MSKALSIGAILSDSGPKTRSRRADAVYIYPGVLPFTPSKMANKSSLSLHAFNMILTNGNCDLPFKPH